MRGAFEQTRELSPRFPCRRLCRCVQARGALPRPALFARQAGGVPRDRHPCRRRPLRSGRSGSEPRRRMARRHRAADGRTAGHPGSPALARAWLRPQDRLIACEIEPQAAIALRQNLRGDTRIKTLEIDGWTALGAYVPPKERRGLVLVDPPFEQDSDFFRLARGLAAAHRKWSTGIYALWYPIKGRSEPDALAKSLRRLGIGKMLRAELTVAPLSDPTRLNGCGLILVNPPWTLESELSVLMPTLAGILGRQGKGAFKLDWLTRGAPQAAR